MYILIIKYRERGTFSNEHDEIKVFSAILALLIYAIISLITVSILKYKKTDIHLLTIANKEL